MKQATRIRAPAHLSPATRAWYAAVSRDYALESHHLRLLQLAGEAWDRCQQAREILARDGITVNGAQGLKPHPAIAIERDSRLAFADSSRSSGLRLTSVSRSTETQHGRDCPMVRRISSVKRRDIPAPAIEAWRRGDERALARALGLGPWEFSPLPHRFAGAYALPREKPSGGSGLAMDESWPKIKALQIKLYEVGGEPGVDA